MNQNILLRAALFGGVQPKCSLSLVLLFAPLQLTALVVGTPMVRGSIDKSMIERNVQFTMPAIEHCYQQQLMLTPSLEGQLIVHFTVTPKGVVGLALLDGDGLAPWLDRCVVQAFAAMHFPPAPDAGRVEVYYPLSFSVTAKKS